MSQKCSVMRSFIKHFVNRCCQKSPQSLLYVSGMPDAPPVISAVVREISMPHSCTGLPEAAFRDPGDVGIDRGLIPDIPDLVGS